MHIVRQVPFSQVKNTTLAFQALTRKQNVPYGSEKITVAPKPAEKPYEVRPSATLAIKTKAGAEYTRVLELTTHAINLSQTFKLELFSPDVPAQPKKPGAEVLKLAATSLPYKQPRKGPNAKTVKLRLSVFHTPPPKGKRSTPYSLFEWTPQEDETWTWRAGCAETDDRQHRSGLQAAARAEPLEA